MSNWTDERHEAARAYCKAATPGPWEWDTGPEEWQRYWLWKAMGVEVVIDPGWDGTGRQSMTVSDADAKLISQARADLPAALDEIERLQKRIAELEAAEKQRMEREEGFNEL